MFGLFRKKTAPVYPTDTVTSAEGLPITFTFFKHASLAIDFDGRRIYVGKDLDLDEQITISINPSQKLDMDTPNKAPTMEMLSTAEY